MNTDKFSQFDVISLLHRSYSCSYTITANESYSDVVIQIKVLNASLEPATGCWRDSVEIIDGSNIVVIFLYDSILNYITNAHLQKVS